MSKQPQSPAPTIRTTTGSRRAFLRNSCAGMLALSTAGLRPAWASTYPTHPVRVIVPYAPGGQGDVFARILSEPLAGLLGQSVIVENRPGATGMLGTRNVIREAPNGLALLMGQTGEIAIIPSANPNAGYDTMRDLAPIAMVGNSPLVLIAPKNAPFNTIQELAEQARRDGSNIAYASSGTATPGHLAAAALGMGLKADMVHVPYKGAGQAMTDVIGGQVGLFFSSTSAAMSHIKAGTVKALAVASLERIAALPDVPTIHETVLPGFQFSLWGGYFAPKATPDEIVQRLNQDVNTLLARPEIRERFEADGTVIKANTSDQFKRFVQAETIKYDNLIKALDITVG